MPFFSKKPNLKKCPKCHKDKHPNLFYTHRSTPDYKSIFCKECQDKQALHHRKHCSKCLKLLPYSKFHTKNASRDHLRHKCKDCVQTKVQEDTNPINILEEIDLKRGSFLKHIKQHHPSLYKTLINNKNKP